MLEHGSSISLVVFAASFYCEGMLESINNPHVIQSSFCKFRPGDFLLYVIGQRDSALVYYGFLRFPIFAPAQNMLPEMI